MPAAMPWLVKLYLLGLFLSFFSALFGLVGFLGDLMPLQGLDPCLSGHWTGSEDGQSPRVLVGDVRTNKAVGSFA